MTNEQAILRYLKKEKSATKLEILKACGVYESGEYIRRLRNKGHKIALVWCNGVNRCGKVVRYGIYLYKGMRK